MLKYGKTSQNAISAISYLAQHYKGESSKLVSSLDIAEDRELPKPLVAKLLTVLSQTGIVKGAPGPRGGYRLAKDPAEISLKSVIDVFEKNSDCLQCPYGPKYCGKNDPCPLHDKLEGMAKMFTHFIENTTFAEFAPSSPAAIN